jgi:hypothetical protein
MSEQTSMKNMLVLAGAGAATTPSSPQLLASHSLWVRTSNFSMCKSIPAKLR